MRSAVVVAGGFSTRFGEEHKAVAELAETPLIRRVADRIEGVVDELVINCRADQQPAIAKAMGGYGLDIDYALDERRIFTALEALEYVLVEKPEIEAVASTGSFENINTHEDLRVAADRLCEPS